ncbi:IS3 family transposase [Viridibacillus arvi]|uniref:IS3 family transposase n=1 Tax=Viridibacillus arvi TaxID=263475 RepID=UPI003D28760A
MTHFEQELTDYIHYYNYKRLKEKLKAVFSKFVAPLKIPIMVEYTMRSNCGDKCIKQ